MRLKIKSVVSIERIQQSILLIRGQKVILDRDLAMLYGVATKVLKQAVRRNAGRFPDDFMFVLTREELAILRSQIVTSRSWGGSRHVPMAFTEHGVAMLSSVLNSERAVKINIEIMRTFVQLRNLLASHEDLADKLDELEKKYDEQFRIVFEAIRQIMAPPPTPKKKIGFHVEEAKAPYRPIKEKKQATKKKTEIQTEI